MTRPSNDAIAQAFLERTQGAIGESRIWLGYIKRTIMARAREIDAAKLGDAPKESEIAAAQQWVCANCSDPAIEHVILVALDVVKSEEDLLTSAPTPPKQEPSAYLVCNGRTFTDRVFLTKIAAEKSMSDRKDGSEAVPLFLQCATQPAPTPDDDVRMDAERWKTFKRFLHDGRIPGPGHGRHIKLIEICPMYGEEREVRDIFLESAIDAAIREASTTARDDVMSKSKAKRVAVQKGESSDAK